MGDKFQRLLLITVIMGVGAVYGTNSPLKAELFAIGVLVAAITFILYKPKSGG